MESHKQQFWDVMQDINSNGINYVIVRGFLRLPDSGDNDIDLVPHYTNFDECMEIIKKHLDLPVCLITSDKFNEDHNNFDHVIVVEKPNTDQTKRFYNVTNSYEDTWNNTSKITPPITKASNPLHWGGLQGDMKDINMTKSKKNYYRRSPNQKTQIKGKV